MFRVYYTNFQYFSQNEGKTLEEAKAIAKKACFQALIYDPQGEPVCSFCPIGGFRTY